MAEEEHEDDLKMEEGKQSSQKPKAYGGYMNRRCNARLEELSKPRKWTMLATWREHRCVFDPERMQALKERIQEEFSMSPEETEVYFNQLRKRTRGMLNKKALAKQIRREKACARELAYATFKKVIRKAIKYAFLHPPPPIVSPVIRETSNKILAILSELHCVDVPKRETTDRMSLFLLYLADWAAILLSNVYYEVSVGDKVDSRPVKPQCPSDDSSPGSEEGECEENESGYEGQSDEEEGTKKPDTEDNKPDEVPPSETDTKPESDTEDETYPVFE